MLFPPRSCPDSLAPGSARRPGSHFALHCDTLRSTAAFVAMPIFGKNMHQGDDQLLTPQRTTAFATHGEASSDRFGRSTQPHQRYYEQLVSLICQRARAAFPSDATVLVMTKGDDALLDLGVRHACHFPQDRHGLYAGHHPRDGAAAVAHLEHLRRQGAEFLVVPATSLWWLDYYTEFRAHLDSRYSVIAAAADAYLFYDLRADLRPRALAGRSAPDSRFRSPASVSVSLSGTRSDASKSISLDRRTMPRVLDTSEPQRSALNPRHVLLGEFDPMYYRTAYPEMDGTDEELLDHYLHRGWQERP